eukprot:COSAG02_NODE_8793_length_2442_cov_33.843790_3_plen_34_part_00
MTVAGNPGEDFLTTHRITQDDVGEFAEGIAAKL